MERSDEASVLLTATTAQDDTLRTIHKFLTTSVLPEFTSTAARYKFMKKVQRYFVQDSHMYRQYPNRIPVRVLLEESARRKVLEEAHE
ncbi:hypothetical protein DICSQDRAFT_73894, partial [Dichomitus squalens LYAD-421 SS1]